MSYSDGNAYPPPEDPNGGYPPPSDYGQGYGGPPPPPGPAGYGTGPGQQWGQGGAPTNSDDQLWALLSHVGGLLFSFVAPLVIYLVKKDESAYVAHHAREALNFQITLAIGYVISYILTIVSFGILFFVPLLIWVAMLVFGILAAVAANKGEWYRYPVCIRFVK